MRDDSPATRALLSLLSGHGDSFVSTRPKLNQVTGSALGTQLLLRMLWRWEASGRKAFVRFAEPSAHELYRPGHSWTEELGWTRREYDTAVGSVSTRLPSGRSVEQEVRRQGLTPRCMVMRWQDGNHRMWWEVIEPVCGQLISQVYARWDEPVQRPAVQPAVAAPAAPPGAAQPLVAASRQPADPEGHIIYLMGVLYEVTGTYGNRAREAKAAKDIAAAIRRGEYPRECARDALIELRDDMTWRGPKGWPEVLTRMTNFLPRWRAAQDEQPVTPPVHNNDVRQTVPVPPPARGGQLRMTADDEDVEILKGRNYADLAN